jgi:hypothetical protein
LPPKQALPGSAALASPSEIIEIEADNVKYCWIISFLKSQPTVGYNLGLWFWLF